MSYCNLYDVNCEDIQKGDCRKLEDQSVLFSENCTDWRYKFAVLQDGPTCLPSKPGTPYQYNTMIDCIRSSKACNSCPKTTPEIMKNRNMLKSRPTKITHMCMIDFHDDHSFSMKCLKR